MKSKPFIEKGKMDFNIIRQEYNFPQCGIKGAEKSFNIICENEKRIIFFTGSI